MCSYNKTTYITRCNHRNGAVFSMHNVHMHHIMASAMNQPRIFMLSLLLLPLLSSYARIASEMISVVGRDFHLWNVFFAYALSRGRFYLVPFSSFCVYFHPLYTNIWLITLLFICKKWWKKHTVTDTDTRTDKLLAANWIDFLAGRFSLSLAFPQCY